MLCFTHRIPGDIYEKYHIDSGGSLRYVCRIRRSRYRANRRCTIERLDTVVGGPSAAAIQSQRSEQLDVREQHVYRPRLRQMERCRLHRQSRNVFGGAEAQAPAEFVGHKIQSFRGSNWANWRGPARAVAGAVLVIAYYAVRT